MLSPAVHCCPFAAKDLGESAKTATRHPDLLTPSRSCTPRNLSPQGLTGPQRPFGRPCTADTLPRGENALRNHSRSAPPGARRPVPR